MSAIQQVLLSEIVVAAAGGSDAVTTAWVSQVVTNGGSVSASRQGIVNTLIAGLRTDGILTKLDRLWLFAAEDQPSALTSMVNPATGLAINVNSLAFTANSGYTSTDNVTPSSYINSSFDPSTNGVNLTLNSTSFSVWNIEGIVDTLGAFSNGGYDGVQALLSHYPWHTGGAYQGVNDSTGNMSNNNIAPYANTHLISNRSSSSQSEAYQNGSAVSGSPFSSTSTAMPNLNGTFQGYNNQGTVFDSSQNTIAMAHYGGSLTSTEAANFYSRLRTYMTAVGVP